MSRRTFSIVAIIGLLLMLSLAPTAMGGSDDSDDGGLTEIDAGLIYFIVKTIEAIGIEGLVLLLFVGIILFIVGLFIDARKAITGLIVFLVIYVLIVALWLGADDIVNGFIKPLGYVLSERP